MPKKKNRSLTTKQYDFIYALLDGKTRAEAYRIAYNADKMKQQSIHSNAYKLFHDEPVQAEYQRLLQEQNKEVLDKWNKGRVVKELDTMVELAKENISTKGLNKTNTEALLKAIDRIADLITLSAKDHVKLQMERDKQSGNHIVNPMAEAVKKMENRKR